MFRRFAKFQNDETDPSTGQLHASPLLKLDKNDFIEGGSMKRTTVKVSRSMT